MKLKYKFKGEYYSLSDFYKICAKEYGGGICSFDSKDNSIEFIDTKLNIEFEKHLELVKWFQKEVIDSAGIPNYRFGEGKEDWEIEIIHQEFLKKYNLI